MKQNVARFGLMCLLLLAAFAALPPHIPTLVYIGSPLNNPLHPAMGVLFGLAALVFVWAFVTVLMEHKDPVF